MATRKAATPRVGYRSPDDPDPNALEQRITELRRKRILSLDEYGNINQERDPESESQAQILSKELARLNNMIPDTPFKGTQGYVGLEMRKALNDAVQAGDTGLGLATGNDQNAFYGRQFNPSQTKGQNYNYNVSYPPVLKKLARQYGADFGPMDVKLLAPEPDSRNWPPRPLRTMVKGAWIRHSATT